MSLKRTALTAAIFILLAVLYVADGRRRDAQDAARREAVRPFGSDSAGITEITLNRMGSRIRLHREDGVWKITEPIRADADPEVMRGLLELLASQESGGTQDASDSELEAYGLARPAYSIIVQSAKGTTEVVFGQEAPLAGRVYARMRDGARVFTIARDLAEAAIRPVNELRDRRLLPMDITQAEEFAVSFEGRTLEARREGKDWRILRPMEIEADTEAVSDFLQSVQIARIENYMDTATQELAALGLEAPTVVAIFKQGDEKHSLLIGHRKLGEESPVYYAKRGESGGVFTVSQELFMRLRVRASDLRNKAIFTLGRDETATLELEFGGRVTRLRRGEDGLWRFDDESGRRADPATVEQMLTRLFRLTVAEYLEVQPLLDMSGLDSPYVRVEIGSADGKRREGLETGRSHTNPDHVYARRISMDGAASEVFLISSAEPGNFFLLPEAFADRTILSFDPKAVKLFTVAAQSQTMSFQREDDAWVASVMGGQEFYQIKSSLAERFVTAALGLRWRKKLDPANDADAAMITKSGLDSPKGVFAFYDESGAELGRFEQGNADPTAVFVRTAGGDVLVTDRESYAAFVGALSAFVQLQ